MCEVSRRLYGPGYLEGSHCLFLEMQMIRCQKRMVALS